jgi:hypothetical protein
MQMNYVWKGLYNYGFILLKVMQKEGFSSASILVIFIVLQKTEILEIKQNQNRNLL